MDLSTLSGRELRQLLDAARARGQAQLTYQILQEMEARRTERRRPRGLFRMRRPDALPTTLTLDESPEGAEDDIPPMPSGVAPAPEPQGPLEPPPPLVLAPKPRSKPARAPSVPPSRRRTTAPPAPDATLPSEPVPPPELMDSPRPSAARDDPPDERLPPLAIHPSPRRRLSRASAAFFAVGMAAGVVVGVGASELWRGASPGAAPNPVETAAVTPPATPTVPPPVAPDPAPAAPGPAPAATPTTVSPDSPPETDSLGPEPASGPEPSPDATDLAEAPQDDCAAQSTPADRTICGDPELQGLQQDLRRAYARALEAHEDRDVLRQRQLAWREIRNDVSDPDRLARLYQERIRRLNAATEAARRAR